MRNAVDDLLRIAGLAQGVQWVLVTLGVGAFVAAVVGGALALYLLLPWWSVLLGGVGAFAVTAGVAGLLIKRFVPHSDLSRVLDSGIQLRSKLLADPASDPGIEAKAAWEVRFKDWLADVLNVVEKAAPYRLSTFQLDILIAGNSMPKVAQWKRYLLTEIDLTIERLSVLRSTL